MLTTPVSECPCIRPLRHICSINPQPQPSMEGPSQGEFTDVSEVVTSYRLLYTALGWIPALAASASDWSCWGHPEDRLAKEGKGAEGRKGNRQEDAMFGPGVEFYVLLPGLANVQSHILF